MTRNLKMSLVFAGPSCVQLCNVNVYVSLKGEEDKYAAVGLFSFLSFLFFFLCRCVLKEPTSGESNHGRGIEPYRLCIVTQYTNLQNVLAGWFKGFRRG